MTTRLLGFFLAVLFLAFDVGAVRAGEIDALHARILREPGNAELNLRFARLAEDQGVLRWALVAYERVLVNDPDNFDAKVGLMRIRRALQPAFTLVTAEFGAAYQSNPLYYLPNGKSEFLGQGSLSLRDERHIAGQRWRTTGAVAGQVRQRYDDLNYGYVGGETGPIFDLYPGLSVHTALGAAAAYFNERFYYGEGSASATFESNFEGAYRALRFRVAYRSYDDFFPSQEGFYTEIRGRFAHPGVLGDGSVAIFSPFVLWSDISGNVTNALVTEIQPGAYTEYGGRIEIYKKVTNWMTLGASFSASQRDYRSDVLPNIGDKRTDRLLSPGATVLFPGLFGFQTDLRLDYRFLKDHSNDQTKSFEDHLVSATVVKRFDPTLGTFAP